MFSLGRKAMCLSATLLLAVGYANAATVTIDTVGSQPIGS